MVPRSFCGALRCGSSERFLDRGHLFDVQDVSGVMAEPPVAGDEYNVLVPQVNADGNDIDGLRNVNVRVPLGTSQALFLGEPISASNSSSSTGLTR